jgi:NADH-quinone oxidoreductase subunit F
MRFDEILMQARTNWGCPDDFPWVRVSGAPEATADVFETLDRGLRESGTEARIIKAGSFGYDDLEPLITVFRPAGPALLYGRVSGAEALGLAADYLKSGTTSPDRALCTMGEGRLDGIARAEDLPLFRLQERVALRNCGLSDPEDLDQYIAWGQGYAGLSKALQMDPADIIESLQTFGLRGNCGRGLADTLRVLRNAESAEGGEKYMVCNGVDGGLDVSVSRLLLTGDPHTVLEGMLIVAFAMGASRCVVCPNGAPSSVETTGITKALEKTRRKGLAGSNILDSSFSCDFEIRQASPSLVMGEDTAILRFLEGRQAMPVIRPREGFLRFSGKPTLVASPETLSKVSALFRDASGLRGASKQTRTVVVSGNVMHPCVVEVPPDTTIRTLVEEIAGGVVPDRNVKAIGFGPAGGRLLGPDGLDLSIDSEPVVQARSTDGSTVIEVIDTERCAVELAEERMAFLQTQTCGKCVFCREGILQMSDILHSVTAGEGSRDDLELLATLGKAMETGSICFIGRTAAGPVVGGLELFRHEYDAHIKDKKCPMAKG